MLKNFAITLLLFAGQLHAQQISFVPVGKLTSELDRVTSVAFSSDGMLMVAGDRKGNLQLWDLDQLSPMGRTEVSDDIIHLEFLRENKEIVAIDASGNLNFFFANNLSKSRSSEIPDDPILVTVDRKSVV